MSRVRRVSIRKNRPNIGKVLRDNIGLIILLALLIGTILLQLWIMLTIIAGIGSFS
jgi:hypothetical protein